jgi:hypothetical protein
MWSMDKSTTAKERKVMKSLYDIDHGDEAAHPMPKNGPSLP